MPGQDVSETRDRALNRIRAEIDAGLRHGYFSFSLTCEVINGGRRRLILHAGRNYQFVIPADECEATNAPPDRADGVSSS